MENRKIYAVIDTNVIVSALISGNPRSNPMIVMAAVFSGKITPVYNDEILREYREVLTRSKFNLEKQDIDDATAVFEGYGLNLNRTMVVNVDFPDLKDVVFYEVKMSKADAYLVTGNKKHFPNHPLVVTPKEMVDILSNVADDCATFFQPLS